MQGLHSLHCVQVMASLQYRLAAATQQKQTWNHVMFWDGRDLKAHLTPPPAMGRDTSSRRWCRSRCPVLFATLLLCIPGHFISGIPALEGLFSGVWSTWPSAAALLSPRRDLGWCLMKSHPTWTREEQVQRSPQTAFPGEQCVQLQTCLARIAHRRKDLWQMSRARCVQGNYARLN